MKRVTTWEFVSAICLQYDISRDMEQRIYPVKGKFKANGVGYKAKIVDKDGNISPYMLGNLRNEEKLKDAIYLKYNRGKTIEEVTKEANITLKTEKCKICEGNGWYSEGIKYYFNNLTCEI